MATAAQITANQANSQHSTGPRSAEGKARSSQNNLQYGFRSQSILLHGDGPTEYEALLEELTNHFTPDDLTEERQVREMADAEWRLRRVRLYQQARLTCKIQELAPLHPGADPITLQALAFDAIHRESSGFAQLLRYETKFERQYNAAYNQWSNYQKDQDRIQHRDAETALLTFLAPPRHTPNPEPAPPVLPDEPNSDAAPAPETARNAPCPCGSGLKYKRCCGKAAPVVVGSRHRDDPDLRPQEERPRGSRRP